MTEKTDYKVWATNQPAGRYSCDSYPRPWWPTQHIIKARSPKDARNKMIRKFARMGLHHMSLVAVPIEVDPNKGDSR